MNFGPRCGFVIAVTLNAAFSSPTESDTVLAHSDYWTVKTPCDIRVINATEVEGIPQMIEDFNASTVTHFSLDSMHDTGKITIEVLKGDYTRRFGFKKVGRADAYSWDPLRGWRRCQGHCNDEPENRVLYARVYLNTGADDWSRYSQASMHWDRHVATHETGHVLGFGHVLCISPYGASVMKPATCFDPGDTMHWLGDHDRDDVNDKYWPFFCEW